MDAKKYMEISCVLLLEVYSLFPCKMEWPMIPQILG